jgi:hypothetical protein
MCIAPGSAASSWSRRQKARLSGTRKWVLSAAAGAMNAFVLMGMLAASALWAAAAGIVLMRA